MILGVVVHTLGMSAMISYQFVLLRSCITLTQGLQLQHQMPGFVAIF